MPNSVRTIRNKNEIPFCCQAPEAKAVFLAGTFNGWNCEATPMQRQADGSWSVSLRLPSGYYEYKFLVDGSWSEPSEEDAGESARCVPNSFGTANHAIEVPQRAD